MMSMPTWTCVVAALLCLLSPSAARPPVPPQRPSPARPDAEAILGRWKVVRAEAAGKHLAQDTSTKQVWTITRDGIAIDFNEAGVESGAASYKLDPAARPRGIDLRFSYWRGSTFLGIYEVKGDRVRIAYTRAVGRRPGSLTMRGEERGTVLLELQRQR